ncbi:MAG: hypothetical protein JRF25_04285 [Deltaproteobacteria bacterium]|nr:hypothetical protein [Deltaproteobacteria bacterium]
MKFSIKKFKCLQIVVGMLMTVFLLFTGCAGMLNSMGVSSDTSAQSEEASIPLYRDFEDVAIPRELKEDKKSTYVIESAGYRSGILALKGRVERNSLIDFFKDNMSKDNWKAITSFKTPKRAIMLFQKENRWCMINITEKEINTYIEIGVVPTIAGVEPDIDK